MASYKMNKLHGCTAQTITLYRSVLYKVLNYYVVHLKLIQVNYSSIKKKKYEQRKKAQLVLLLKHICSACVCATAYSILHNSTT